MDFKDTFRACHKATFLMVKKEEGKLLLIEKVSLRAHLLNCSYCRIFYKQSLLLNKLFLLNHAHISNKPPFILGEDFKTKLNKLFKQH